MLKPSTETTDTSRPAQDTPATIAAADTSSGQAAVSTTRAATETHPRHLEPSTARFSGLIKVALLMTVIIVIGFIAYQVVLSNRGSESTSLTHTVARRTLHDIVIERGTLQSQKTVEGRCELGGWENKIIFIVPEGTVVEKGDVVVRFDSEEIDDEIDEQEIEVNEAKGQVEQAIEDIEVQKNTNASNIAAAELSLTLAKLDLAKYKESDYKSEVDELNRSIAEGEAELEKIQDELENSKTLVKKGFRPPELLKEIQLRLNSAQFRLERDRQQLNGKETYERERTLTELQFNADEADRKLSRAKTTASAELRKAESLLTQAENKLEMEEEDLAEWEERLSRCEITAPQAGTIAYANHPWMDADERIKEGASVRRRQDVFYLPDMRNMQVTVNIHESVVNKVKEGQKAVIRIDAFPETDFSGTVDRVAQLATSSFFSAANNYHAVVLIDDFPEDVSLKPGMTAEVEVKVGTYDDIIAVPVNAVTEHFQQSYVYVKRGGGFVREKVSVGRNTHSFVEITQGLEPGTLVAMDAYQRGMNEFGERERDAEESQQGEVAGGRRGDDQEEPSRKE